MIWNMIGIIALDDIFKHFFEVLAFILKLLVVEYNVIVKKTKKQRKGKQYFKHNTETKNKLLEPHQTGLISGARWVIVSVDRCSTHDIARNERTCALFTCSSSNIGDEFNICFSVRIWRTNGKYLYKLNFNIVQI